MAPRDKKGILFISRAVVQSYLSALCVHSRLANVLLRFNLDNKFQRGGGTESYVREQTLENQSRQLPESALSRLSPQSSNWITGKTLMAITLLNPKSYSDDGRVVAKCPITLRLVFGWEVEELSTKHGVCWHHLLAGAFPARTS